MYRKNIRSGDEEKGQTARKTSRLLACPGAVLTTGDRPSQGGSSRSLEAERIRRATRLLHGDCHTLRIANVSAPVGARLYPEPHTGPPCSIGMKPVPTMQRGALGRVLGYSMTRILQGPVTTYIGDVEHVSIAIRAIFNDKTSQQKRS